VRVSPRGVLDIIRDGRIETAPAVLQHTVLQRGTAIIDWAKGDA